METCDNSSGVSSRLGESLPGQHGEPDRPGPGEQEPRRPLPADCGRLQGRIRTDLREDIEKEKCLSFGH